MLKLSYFYFLLLVTSYRAVNPNGTKIYTLPYFMMYSVTCVNNYVSSVSVKMHLV